MFIFNRHISYIYRVYSVEHFHSIFDQAEERSGELKESIWNDPDIFRREERRTKTADGIYGVSYGIYGVSRELTAAKHTI